MASLVDTSVKHFLSSMYGAPVQTGQPGSKIALIDACLVTGFGLRPATSLAVAGGVATVSFNVSAAQPPTVDSVVQIEGAESNLLNGEQRVVASANGVFKFRTSAPDGADSSSSITFKFAPLGWERLYQGTNQAVYRSTDPQSLGMHLYVDDRNSTSTSFRGYESMSALDTGTGSFPTPLQRETGCWWSKSYEASARPTRWLIAGDRRTFYDNTAPGSSAGSTYTGGGTKGFGDALVLRSGGDAWSAFLVGATSANSAASNANWYSFDVLSSAEPYLPRSASGLGTAVAARCAPYTGSGSNSGAEGTLGAFPSDIDGELKLSRCYIGNAPLNNYTPRVELPGLRYVPQSNVANYFERDSTIVESGSGRRLLALPHTSGSGTPVGYMFVDITGPWR